MDLINRQKELGEQLQKLDNDIKQIRNILSQKEREYLIITGKLIEIGELIKEPKEE